MLSARRRTVEAFQEYKLRDRDTRSPGSSRAISADFLKYRFALFGSRLCTQTLTRVGFLANWNVGFGLDFLFIFM